MSKGKHNKGSHRKSNSTDVKSKELKHKKRILKKSAKKTIIDAKSLAFKNLSQHKKETAAKVTLQKSISFEKKYNVSPKAKEDSDIDDVDLNESEDDFNDEDKNIDSKGNIVCSKKDSKETKNNLNSEEGLNNEVLNSSKFEYVVDLDDDDGNDDDESDDSSDIKLVKKIKTTKKEKIKVKELKKKAEAKMVGLNIKKDNSIKKVTSIEMSSTDETDSKDGSDHEIVQDCDMENVDDSNDSVEVVESDENKDEDKKIFEESKAAKEIFLSEIRKVIDTSTISGKLLLSINWRRNRLMDCVIHVKNISKKANVNEVCANVVRLVNADYPKNLKSKNEHRGYGFFRFANANDARKAMDVLNKTSLYDKTLIANKYVSKKIYDDISHVDLSTIVLTSFKFKDITESLRQRFNAGVDVKQVNIVTYELRFANKHEALDLFKKETIDVDGMKVLVNLLYNDRETFDVSVITRASKRLPAVTGKRPKECEADAVVTKKSKIVGEESVESTGAASVSVDAQVKLKDAHVKGKEANVIGKEAHVKGKEANVIGKEAHVKGKEANVIGKDAHVKGKEANVIGKVAHVKGKEANVTGKDVQVKIDGQVKGKESHVTGKEANIIGKEANIKGKEANIKGKEAPIKEKEVLAKGIAKETEARNTKVTGSIGQPGVFASSANETKKKKKHKKKKKTKVHE